ncbi:MAG: hypothetical protein ACOYMN_09155 [Roseimicrobium sp.]|jgi:hypothetical protein
MTSNAPSPQVNLAVPLFNTGAALPALLEAFRSLHIEEGSELVLVDDDLLNPVSEALKPLAQLLSLGKGKCPHSLPSA